MQLFYLLLASVLTELHKTRFNF